MKVTESPFIPSCFTNLCIARGVGLRNTMTTSVPTLCIVLRAREHGARALRHEADADADAGADAEESKGGEDRDNRLRTITSL